MSNYTTSTSDRKKKTALIWWLIGAVGILGIENFYVGKIKNGLIRALLGLLFLGVLGTVVSTPELSMDADKGGIVFSVVIMWAIIALPNLFKLLLGVFRDNIGAALRE